MVVRIVDILDGGVHLQSRGRTRFIDLRLPLNHVVFIEEVVLLKDFFEPEAVKVFLRAGVE